MNRYFKVAPMLALSTVIVLAGIPAPLAFLLRMILDAREIIVQASSGEIGMVLLLMVQLLFHTIQTLFFFVVFLFAINQLFSEMTIGAQGIIIKDAFWSIRIPWDRIAAYEETGTGPRIARQILRSKEKIPRVNRGLLKIPLGWMRGDTVNVTHFGIVAGEDLRALSSKYIR